LKLHYKNILFEYFYNLFYIFFRSIPNLCATFLLK